MVATREGFISTVQEMGSKDWWLCLILNTKNEFSKHERWVAIGQVQEMLRHLSNITKRVTSAYDD
jgi:hypothetical protein